MIAISKGVKMIMHAILVRSGMTSREEPSNVSYRPYILPGVGSISPQ